METNDVPEHLGFDGAIERALENLAECTNHIIKKSREDNEPLARIQFHWVRFRRSAGTEECFIRVVAIKGDSSLGPLN